MSEIKRSYNSVTRNEAGEILDHKNLSILECAGSYRADQQKGNKAFLEADTQARQNRQELVQISERLNEIEPLYDATSDRQQKTRLLDQENQLLHDKGFVLQGTIRREGERN